MITAQMKVQAEVNTPAVLAQVVEYRWSRGATLLINPDRPVLHRRASPSVFGAAAACGTRLERLGQLNFAPADHQFAISTAPDDRRTLSISCRFDPDWFSRVTNYRDRWSNVDLARYLDVRNGRLDQAMRWLGMELMSPGFASPLFIESTAGLLAVELSRHFSSNEGSFRLRTQNGKLPSHHLRWIVDYIEAAPDKCPTLEELARICGISSAHLRRSFKNTTGKTIHAFVEEVRLSKARLMLSETDLALKEVAFRLGFPAPSAFASAFRKLQGETPSGYRRRIRT